MAFGQLEDGQRPGRPISDINVTPLVDVMLVLMVVFILTAPIVASSIRLELPKAGAAATAAPQPVPPVRLSVDSSGQTFLDDQAVSLPELAQRLARTALEQPATELHLRADQAAAYGRVAEVLAIAQQAGLSRIGFVTQAPADSQAAASGKAAVSPAASAATSTSATNKPAGQPTITAPAAPAAAR